MEPTCKRCGARVPAAPVGGAFQGICPACLARAALEPTTPSSAADPLPLKPGDTFRGLQVVELLGRGGMGIVYKARQIHLDRDVALKILPPDLAREAEFVDRFQREAKLLASLTHPNIVALHDYGVEAGLCFLVMEYVDGNNLRAILRQNRLKPAEALAIVPQLCDALQHAHAEGLVHRDIKPENILMDRKGRVKIADFGLAKLVRGEARPSHTITRTDEVLGTPNYMAPEQLEGSGAVDHRADIYAMGVVFYEMLTGGLPVGRFDPPSRCVQVDVRLDEIVLRTLEKQPDRRYQHAREVRDDVTRITTAPPAAPRADRRVVGAQAAAAALAVLAMVLIAAHMGSLPALAGSSPSTRALVGVVGLVPAVLAVVVLGPRLRSMAPNAILGILVLAQLPLLGAAMVSFIEGRPPVAWWLWVASGLGIICVPSAAFTVRRWSGVPRGLVDFLQSVSAMVLMLSFYASLLWLVGLLKEAPAAPAVPPPARNEARRGPPDEPPPELRAKASKITYSFEDADVRTVLDILIRQSGANIIASQPTTGRVTLSFNNVPWPDALDAVAKQLGLKLVWEPSGIVRVVAP